MKELKYKKKNKKIDKRKSWADTLVDVRNYIYILFTLTVYVLVLHNQYYDITKTRYTWFVGISSFFIVTSIFSAILIYTVGNVKFTDSVKELLQKLPFGMLCLFFFANLFAFFVSGSSTHAFYGDNGRYMGLAIYMVIFFVAAILMKHFKGYDSLYVIFSAVILFTLIMALVQHTGVDVFSLKGAIKSNQYDKFISTMGNINIFASYIVIVSGAAFGAYIYGTRLYFKLLYAIVVFVCGMAIMTANSDSAYLGLSAILVAGAITGACNGRIKELLEATLIFFTGNLVMAIWHTKMSSYPNYGGLAHKLDNVKLAAFLVCFFALMYAITVIVKARFKAKKLKANKNESEEKADGAANSKKSGMSWKTKVRLRLIFIISFCGLLAVGFIIYGINSGDSLFKFDYKWGTYRGYIWSKCWETFKEAPALNKLFGFGNESIKQVVTVPNYNDMVEKTNRIYDNAHNEVLQYLITLGLFGALSYIALFAASVWYMFKNGRKDMHTYIPMFVVCGYFVQGLVNLNQPITTPLYFVFLAMGVGYACRSK